MKRIRRSIHRPYRIKPRESILRKPVFWFTILIFILAGLAIYFFIFWQGFQIKNIVISGNQNVKTDGLEQLVSGEANKKILFFDSKSIFLADVGNLDSLILKKYPEVDSADVQKKLPQTITVNIAERKPFATVCGFKDQPQGLCFLMDVKGVIFDEVKTEDVNLFIVQQHKDIEAILGNQAIDGQTVSGISKIQKDLQDNFNPLGIKTADIVSADRMDIITTEGWQVYFNLSSDMNLQIAKLNLLVQKTFPKPEDRAKLQYIDLRFENRAYYK